MDTRTYIVKFLDGADAEYAANIIVESMVSKCDPDGNQYLLIEEIVNYKTDKTAQLLENAHTKVKGKHKRSKTTQGWWICVKWRDQMTTWERLLLIKESNLVELTEYAIAKGLDHTPAFSWWVSFTIKKQDCIISVISNQVHKRQYKFGIFLPATVKEGLEEDKQNRSTFWQDAINKETENVKIAFNILI